LPAHLLNPLKDPSGFNTGKWKEWWNGFVKNLVISGRPSPWLGNKKPLV
jgi:hypothetical protein